MASYEWKTTPTGRRYVRTAGKVAVAEAAPVTVAPEAVAAAEYVPEVKIEDPEQVKPKRGPGRPRKDAAPVTIEDDDDD